MSDTELKQELKATKIAYQNAVQNANFHAGFLGRVAHEIRAPLGSLMSLHQLILNDLCENPQEEKEFIKNAYDYAKKLLNLMDQVIEVSKLNVGKLSLDLKIIRSKEFLASLIRIMEIQAFNGNINLVLDQNMIDCFLYVDQEKLLQGFCYLLEVVIAHFELATILLSAESQDQNTTIKLSLPYDEYIFSESINFSELPLTEIEKLNQNPELSAGLKMSLASTLIEVMGGKITIQNIIPISTTLEVSFPNFETR
ncbi:MAG: HAMP domain-containing histidine kinase [Cyanobacterium sp. T60_A2020_053]|nr:HAMP domain-containing histidine kinase [Cyanobacterium sp. T60_A2020_053]